MLYVLTPPRVQDDFGRGEFGAPRGDRTHNGVDFQAPPESILLSPVTGEFTKYGTVYRSDPYYRYIQITDDNGNNHRFFYVQSYRLILKTLIFRHTKIGIVQDIAGKYNQPDRRMLNHIHYEIKTKSGEFLNPEDFQQVEYLR